MGYAESAERQRDAKEVEAEKVWAAHSADVIRDWVDNLCMGIRVEAIDSTAGELLIEDLDGRLVERCLTSILNRDTLDVSLELEKAARSKLAEVLERDFADEIMDECWERENDRAD